MSHFILGSTDPQRNLSRALAFACALLLAAFAIQEAHARSLGGARGGGFSRSGPAAGGGFSSRNVGQRNYSSRAAVRQESRSQRQESYSGTDPRSQQERYEQRQERQEQRQDYRNAVREDMQDINYYDDDWDDYYGYPVIFTGVYTVDSLISADYYKQLPCTPKTVSVDGLDYRQCGDEWFLPVYSSGQLVYRVVTAPASLTSPAAKDLPKL